MGYITYDSLRGLTAKIGNVDEWFPLEKEKKMGKKNSYDDMYVQVYERYIPAYVTNYGNGLKVVNDFSTGRYTVDVSSTIKKVIFNDPATIVFWTDGSKTVVKCENEPFDKEKGLAMAISKHVLGNKGHYFEIFKKWIED